ncbi:MAG TPA: O-antigen ligase family protein [Candidatus Dormibacteraeota bacterium]|nr:O-antigen ligase family protein [Candidatus Dormibacteraeota bacterium]
MSASLDVSSAPHVRRQLDRAGWLIFGLIFLPTAIGLAAVALGAPWPILFAGPAALAAILVLRTPVVGLYTLFAAALVIPVQTLGFPDSLTDNIPFFVNLSGGGSLNVSGLGISPAEILMSITLLGVIGSSIVSGVTWAKGRLMNAYVLFILAVCLGELNGLVHGGDFKLSLWELRPQVYAFFTFIMGTFLLRDRKQLIILLAVTLAGELFMGIVGSYRYFVTLDRAVANANPILAHEDSYLLSLFAIAVVIGLVWFRRPLVFALLVLSPLPVTALLENHRRAGTGALVLEIVVVLALAYVLEPRLRKALAAVGVILLVAGAVFTIVFWNQQYGALAELIRPIKSLINPNARDLSSDLYRIAETANLRLTFRSSPIFGIGFGHPYYIVYPQTGVQKYDPLWNIIPHNNLLWIPMRMGVIGMVAFWGLIIAATIEAVRIARSASDLLIRCAMVFVLAGIFGLLFTGYYDITIENYRNAIVLGIMLAIINRAGSLARRDQGAHEAATNDDQGGGG